MQNLTGFKITIRVMPLLYCGIVLAYVPANHLNHAVAQSSQSIAMPTPQPDPNMTGRAIKRTGTAFSGRNSVSIKSTDAGFVPRYQQSSGCINCGTVDYINVLGQGVPIDFITGGIISGIIRNEVYQQGQHHPIDPRMNQSMPPTQQHHHDSTHYDIGITMDDGTQTSITHQAAPNFHPGDRIKLIDGEFVPHQP